MGMWPTATLTYGFDVESATGDWYEDDEPVEAGGQVLHDAGFPTSFGVWQDYDGCRMRLYAAFLQASGYNDKGEADSMWLPDDTDDQLYRAADLLGIDVGDAKPRWLLLAEFN
jgi:hypothetical protein